MTALSFLTWFTAHQNATDAEIKAMRDRLPAGEIARLRRVMALTGRD